MINDINELFSTREISMIIWLFIIILFFIIIDKTRSPLLDLFKHLLRFLINPIFIIIVMFFILMVYLFMLFNIFSFSIFKDYFIWYFFVFLSLVAVITEEIYTVKLSEIFFRTIKLSIVPIFIINFYTFDFWIEFIMLPFISIFSIMLVVSETNAKDKSKFFKNINIFSNIILSIVGLVIIFFVTKKLIVNISDVFQITFWVSMFSDIILIFIHIPFLYVLKFLLMYAQISTLIKNGLLKNKLNKFKMKNIRVFLIIFKRCRFNKQKLLFLDKYALSINNPSTYRELNNNIKVLIKEGSK